MNKTRLVLVAAGLSLALTFVFGCASKPKEVDREQVKGISKDVDQMLDEE